MPVPKDLALGVVFGIIFVTVLVITTVEIVEVIK